MPPNPPPKKRTTEPVIDLEQDFGAMRVARLREMLAAQGEECVGCVEKTDYIRKLREIGERQLKQRKK
jgi:hypothetical protein